MTATADLPAAWASTARAAGASAPSSAAVTAAGRDLLDRWAQPRRHYHDVRHLTEVLAAIDLLIEHARDPDAVRLAAWFHDAVYEGRPGDDEEACAVLATEALTALGVPGERVAEVARLVRLTAGHNPAVEDVDGAVLCDADLAILGADPARYAEYGEAIRAEYAHVPEGAFRPARAAVLERLLAGPLYRTPTAVTLWDAAARRNVAAELSRLRAR